MDIALLPAEIGEKVQYWNATINVGFTDHNGKKETSVLPYILKVSYIYGKWKVDDVGVARERGTHEKVAVRGFTADNAHGWPIFSGFVTSYIYRRIQREFSLW